MRAENQKKLQKWIMIIVTLILVVGMLLPFFMNAK
jgi:hypothetical protein